jgi:hypothetical protein
MEQSGKKYEMMYGGDLQDQPNVFMYIVTIPATRVASNYTVIDF